MLTRFLSQSRLLIVSFVATAACMCALGCSGATDSPPPYDGGISYGGASDDGPAPVGPCEDGATKECSVTRVLESGVKICWVGEQTCEDGVWSECHEALEPAVESEAGTEAP